MCWTLVWTGYYQFVDMVKDSFIHLVLCMLIVLGIEQLQQEYMSVESWDAASLTIW